VVTIHITKQFLFHLLPKILEKRYAVEFAGGIPIPLIYNISAYRYNIISVFEYLVKQKFITFCLSFCLRYPRHRYHTPTRHNFLAVCTHECTRLFNSNLYVYLHAQWVETTTCLCMLLQLYRERALRATNV